MPRDWGDEWLDCVDEYMRFQGVSGFPVSHDMGTHLIIRWRKLKTDRQKLPYFDERTTGRDWWMDAGFPALEGHGCERFGGSEDKLARVVVNTSPRGNTGACWCSVWIFAETWQEWVFACDDDSRMVG
jgi:hypothetical protein